MLLQSALSERVEWLEYGELLRKAELWCEAVKAFEAGLETEAEPEKRLRMEQAKALASARCKA